MDSCCVALKVNSHLVNVRNSGFGNGDNAFLGERIRGSLNNNSVWVNRVANSLSTYNKKAMKIKPGAFAVITSNNPREAKALPSRRFNRQRVDPKNVASIILGGGAGTHLFPLTRRAATPAVPIGGCYKLIDIPMSNCINSGINKIFVLTQFNSASLNRHVARTYYGNGINFGDGFVEILAATQTSGEAGKKWFQGTADAVRQFIWVFEDAKNRNIENVVILCGDHLYRMDYMEFVQSHVDGNADITISCVTTDNRIKDAIISHGCFLRECSVQHSVIGERSRLDSGVELQDTVMMGADYYQTELEIISLLAEGKVPIGIGHNTKISNCIIDKNAKIGRDVIIANKDGVQEADRSDEGFYIRSGITIILDKATIKDGTIM